jgi:hypothetical protein
VQISQRFRDRKAKARAVIGLGSKPALDLLEWLAQPAQRLRSDADAGGQQYRRLSPPAAN